MCNGHASSCSGTGDDRSCECEHNTAGKDCDTCQLDFSPAANKPLSDPDYCQPDPSISVTPISATQLQVSWDPPTSPYPPTTYLLCSRVAPNAPCSARLLRGNETTALISNLAPGTTYHVSVTPYFGASVGSEYPSQAATTLQLVICDCELCGVEDEFQPCDITTGECTCKRDVMGARCDQCKPGFHSLNFSSETGCQPCDCRMGGASSRPCNPETGQCYCKDGFIGSPCQVGPGSYTPSLEQTFSITELAVSQLSAPNYLLRDSVSNRLGWRVGSENPFRVRFSVGESGEYLFKPLLSASATAASVTISLTSDNSSTSYSIPADSLDGWSREVDLRSSVVYTVSVGVSPVGALAVVEELFYLPLDSAAIPRERDVLREIYSLCIPYDDSQSICSQAVSISTSLAQSASDCDCEEKGSITELCLAYGGQCTCITSYAGRRCDQCPPGYWMGTDGTCKPCNCDPLKSETSVCNSTGYCYCSDTESTDSTDPTCSRCNPGYTLGSTGSECSLCGCDATGSLDNTCDSITGECSCKPGYQGARCESCQPVHIPIEGVCAPCPCAGGNGRLFADSCQFIEGEVMCACISGHAGSKCNACADGYFAEYTEIGELSSCGECDCNGNGDLVDGKLCDENTGQCLSCVGNTAGSKCEYCKEGFYQVESTQGGFVCQVCDCDVTGSEESICNSDTGFCLCREGFSGERCDQCATNNYNFSTGCPSCSNCFDQVFELYGSLRGRLDWYTYFSQSGCNLLSSPLRLLLESYTSSITTLQSDVSTAEIADSSLVSALGSLSESIIQLNDDVIQLDTLASKLEPSFLSLQDESQSNLRRVRSALMGMGEIFQTYYSTVVRLNEFTNNLVEGIIRSIHNIASVITKEISLVNEQSILTTQTATISSQVLSTSLDTLSAAQSLVELHSNLTSLIGTMFLLQSSIQKQVDLINGTYPEVEEAADVAESLYRDVLALVTFPPLYIPVFSDETFKLNVSLLEEYVRQLKNDSLAQTQISDEEIGRSSVLIETGKFLQNVTNSLLGRLSYHRTQAQNAVNSANSYINMLKIKKAEINMTHAESAKLVELIDRFFDLLNETQQNITIESARATLALIEAAIDDAIRLEQLISTTTTEKTQKSKRDANAADLNVKLISGKIRALSLEIEELERNIQLVEDKSQELREHESEGREELVYTESTLENAVLYTKLIRKRVELLELEYLKLNRSLAGIDIVSEEEVESIIKRISDLEKEVEISQQGLKETEIELIEERAELEDLERAVYESYRQTQEFDSLIGDIREYNSEHACN